jgi:CO/xanthine dehydrogenase FAD-binding subunit
MKPPAFDYLAPETLDEALEAVAEHGWDAKVLAGGQSLVPLLNFRLAQPGVLVDLNRIEGLDYVRPRGDGGLSIGCMTRQRTLERDPRVVEAAPLLAEAIPYIAHPQIRNRSTVGGSLAHADPAAEWPVVAVTLGAELLMRKAGEERRVAAKDFFVGLMTTDLAPDEILVEVTLPPKAARTGWSFQEVARRHGDYATAGVAVLLELDEGDRCASARLVYLSAGETPVAVRRAAEILENDGLSDENIRAAAAVAAREEIEPTDDIHATVAFKRHLAEVVTRRALFRARERATEVV